MSNLYTPQGSAMRAGSNRNSWEANLPYSAEDTARGYGAVPGMTYNSPTQAYGTITNVQATPVGQAVMNAPTVGGLAEGLSLGGSGLFGGINKLFGTDIGANRYGYGENGKQMWTGDLSNNPEALSYFKDNGLTLGAGEGPGLFDMGKELFKGIGTDEIGLGLSLYNSYQNNKRAEDILDMDKAKFALGAGELARQQRKDKDFATNINKSGLGTYSSGQ